MADSEGKLIDPRFAAEVLFEVAVRRLAETHGGDYTHPVLRAMRNDSYAVAKHAERIGAKVLKFTEEQLS